MENLPFAPQTFDLLWCENSVYVIGFERALADWKKLLAPKGTLVVSDLVWLREDAPQTVQAFWKSNYPDMADLNTRLQQANRLGYKLLGKHTLSHQAWANYYEPLERRIEEIRDELKDSAAVSALEQEIPILKQQADGDFGYVFFALQPT